LAGLTTWQVAQKASPANTRVLLPEVLLKSLGYGCPFAMRLEPCESWQVEHSFAGPNLDELGSSECADDASNDDCTSVPDPSAAIPWHT
jgi:hypothetical protein